MLSFLPKKNKQTLLLEYKLRVVTTICFFVCVLFVIALVGLLPSYLNEKAQADVLRTQFGEEGTDEEKAIMVRRLSNHVLVEYLAKEIKSLSAKEKFSVTISQILNDTQSGISLRSFLINEKSVSVSGVADTRTNLTLFQKNLKNNPLFKEVNLPLSDITKNIEAPFTIEIKIK